VPFRPETEVAIDAVTRGLAQARGGIGAADLAFKGERDVVTPTDVAVEDAIRSVVGDALGLPVVGEERGGDPPADGSAYWIVDPICGTRNFASGIPLYCVNLALVEDGRVAVAAVGDPSTGEVHVAEAGRGAWALRDGASRQLRAGADSATIIVEEGRSEGARRERAARFMAAAIRADRWDLRALGSTLSLPYVASGRVAAYLVFWASAIHTAAGSLLASESGATVSDLDGRPWTIRSDAMVASATPELHRDLLELVRD
jgi:myo-inositol-1(or 4)-monophosphatase